LSRVKAVEGVDLVELGGGVARLAVGAGGDELADDALDVPVVFLEVAGEVVEELGVGGPFAL